MPTVESKKIQKSNDLNQANFSGFGLSCYRVLLNLITKIQRHDVNGALISANLVSRTCSLSVAEYAKEFNIEPDNAYAILKTATDKLMNTQFSIQKGIDILKINVCSQAYYRKSQGKIDIEFTPNIMPHLAELTSNFTMYNLNEIAGFDSIYTTRIYELIMQFKTTGKIEITVKDLRFKLGCGAKFKQYYDFKTKTFGHAIEEINQQWTLNIQCEEIKTGKTVTDLIFKFRPTFTRKAYDPVRQKMRTQLTRPRRKTDAEIDAAKIKVIKNQTPTDQQEPSSDETVGGKILKATAKGLAKVGIKPVPEVRKALDERKDNSPKQTIKAVAKGAINADIRRLKQIAEFAKILVETLGMAPKEAYEMAKIELNELEIESN